MPLPRLALALCAAAALLGADGNGYYRYPAIRGNQVVFTAEGDLWSASLTGGRASRLTTHPAEESRAAISPDGKWVAFSAFYEGPQEVYVMPIGGGIPKRLTFESARNQVLGWTPTGEVLYSTQNPKGPTGQLVLACVFPTTLVRRLLPLTDASEASFDETGRTVYFTRMGLHTTGDNARHYRGGTAAELWRYALDGKAEAVKLPLAAPAKRPMWWQGRLYFVSDAKGLDNLWSCKGDGSDAKQLTRHAGFEVRSAAIGDGRIVYQLGADLRVFDIAKGEDRALPIELGSDFDQARERFVKKPMDFEGDFSLAATGDRVVLQGRGQLAVAGVGPWRRVDVAVPGGSRAKEAVLSRDRKWVYAICDAGGEQEIWRFPADGSTGGKALTTGGHTQRTTLALSPDGQLLAHSDRPGHLFLLNLATLENKQIDESPSGYGDLVWSPDSRTLALTRPDTERDSAQVVLYSLETGRATPVTSDKYPCSSPAFSPDGRWLYFLSNRTYQVVNGSPWGDRNMGPYFDRRTKAYGLALQEGLRWPYKAKDELDPAEAKAPEKTDKPAAPPAIQWTGLSERLYEVPLPASNYRTLKTDGKRLYFLDRDAEGKTALKSLEIGSTPAQPLVFSADVRNFDLSQDGKKLLLVRAQNVLNLVDAGTKAPTDLAESTVRTGDWNTRVDPRQEWKQIFVDAWRMHRDYLYDGKLRGVDWTAARRKYEPLVDRVQDRSELNDLLAQMDAELGALHSQVRGGDARPAPDAAVPAFLGGTLERVAEGFRVEHIYQADPEIPAEASPLRVAGVVEGDVITHVNGRSALAVRDMADLLQNQAGQQTLLTLKRRPVVVTPVSAERQNALRYSDWEEGCRLKVLEAAKGDIGYLHLRAMGAPDINSFARDFYAHISRKGLIIDVRRNNGGNIDSWIIEKLLRRAWAFWTHPDMSSRGTNMQQTFRGHLSVLVDERTYSDGETFAQGIKTLGLAPLVGRRTAGAGAWLTDSNVQVDGGTARAAEWGQFLTKDGSWVIEGVGVSPDVEVLNAPHETFLGRDRQLETAIQMLKDKIAKEPLPPLKPKAIPTLR
jgi:tricorn protease